ncbi:MAG: hypothetical protein H6516_04415 [Microthrixaceae bacterium]|nr:hypothetical protein [Microthrixaceae bacterium]MCB9400582.1 hypothetical protein [Microthrixaceae bacterium]
MKLMRLGLVTVVALALVGLASVWSGRPDPEPAAVEQAPMPAVRTGEALPATWYCASGTASRALAHYVFLSNPTGDAATVRLTGYTAGGATPTQTVEVAPKGPLPLDVGAVLGDPTASVLVESDVAGLVVDNQLSDEEAGDRAACARSSSDAWYFPALSITRDAGARLTLFNPFPADAGVDIEIGLDTGTRVPASLAGLVVPAGTARVVDLGQAVQRRDQFTAVVRSRSGRVVAAVAQTFDGSIGPEGLWLTNGVPGPQPRWAFAGGFTGTGVAERLVIQNPGDRRSRVLVQVTPYGGASDPPEPIEVAVEPRHYAVVDLSAETRIPGVGYHSIEVESDRPVVVARTTTLSAGPDPATDAGIAVRPALGRGVALSTGTPVLARSWTVPSINAGADPAPVVAVHNPGEGIARVTLEVVAAGSSSALPGATDVEVAPGDSVVVPLGPAAAPEVAVVVTSSEPVAVERITVYAPDVDLAFDPAVPGHGRNRPLVPLGSS